jgi:hypothetical protein
LARRRPARHVADMAALDSDDARIREQAGDARRRSPFAARRWGESALIGPRST